MLFHRQFWKRVLPCCFSKKLTNSNGIHAVSYYHRPVSRGNDISGAEEDHEDGNANSILPNSNGDDMNTFAVMNEEGTTADILTIGNEARKNTQHPFRQGSVEATPSWKSYVEAPNSNKRWVSGYSILASVQNGHPLYGYRHFSISISYGPCSMIRQTRILLLTMLRCRTKKQPKTMCITAAMTASPWKSLMQLPFASSLQQDCFKLIIHAVISLELYSS